jgi:26S proteasome regulatory subunit N9
MLLPDHQEQLPFLQDLAKKVDSENSQDAFVYATVLVAHRKLLLEDTDGCKKDLDKAEKILDTFDSVESKVHAAFYQTKSAYYKAAGDWASYYRNSLLYLACIELSALTPAERKEQAFDLGMAALVSDSIYNFGELLQHPILAALTGDASWLRDLLLAFNRGDLAAFDAHSGHMAQIPLLVANQQDIRHKIYLAALTEAVFRRPPHQRAMSFDAISADTKVPAEEVEHLVMKALSLGLVRGTIDEVDKVVNFTWVQPRILDMSQIASMGARLGEWGENVEKLGTWIEATGQDIWAP